VDRGFLIISLMAETNSGTTPTAEELKSEWADKYGITAPVVADEGWAVGSLYERDGGIPSQHLIGPGMEILAIDQFPVSESDIEAALPY
jgi:hypothetical protein